MCMYVIWLHMCVCMLEQPESTLGPVPQEPVTEFLRKFLTYQADQAGWQVSLSNLLPLPPQV